MFKEGRRRREKRKDREVIKGGEEILYLVAKWDIMM